MPSAAPRAAVAAPNALAAQAGLDLVHQGGTALDAALAAIMTTYVTEPGIVSALGSAFVALWPAGGDPVVVDGNCAMPGAGHPDRRGRGVREVTLDYGGGITISAGAGSAATYGSFASFDLAHAGHGRAPWRAILAPAIHHARAGFRVGAASGHYLGLAGGSLYAFDPQTRARYVPGGVPVRTGELLRNPDLANALEQLATAGPQDLYTGELGQQVADHVQAEGGLIDVDDLAAYRAVQRPATLSPLAGWTVATNPPPSIGGPVLATMLRMMAGHTLDPDLLLRVQRDILGYRQRHLDLSADLEAAGRQLLDAVRPAGPGPSSPDTAHVSVVDGDGMACAITTSAGYSSGVTVPGTGLILNNCLGEPELNRRGLHALPAGTRVASNMAPTTARHDDGSVLAIGSPGADRITTALMQVLSRFALRGQDLQEAIDAPRLHVEPGESLRAHFEPDEALAAAVARAGAEPVRHESADMYFGGVGAALRDANGDLRAAADPRRAAATAIG